jgi:hypothetical protein
MIMIVTVTVTVTITTTTTTTTNSTTGEKWRGGGERLVGVYGIRYRVEGKCKGGGAPTGKNNLQKREERQEKKREE